VYVDKLDGKIGGEFYDKFSAEWREEQLRLHREIARHQEADVSYEGVQILELARNAQSLFGRQKPHQKRRLLNFVLSNRFAKTVRSAPHSANRLIYWHKKRPIWRKVIFGSPVAGT
jgi:hypothetical protein